MKRKNSVVRLQTTKPKKKKISKNKGYKKGRRFEYRVKEYYEKLGYYVIRKYASIGAEDLVAIKAVDYRNFPYVSNVLHIQCKNLKEAEPLSKTAKNKLVKLAEQTGGKALHIYNNSKHKLVFEELN